ncbi:type II toxin-antitoxin system HicA family toxin [Candidatus Micrarchaeota archaeon]|nr:type II toxin-antitoxin system HicA family toxin [Candidatus Micrarchaeota archaeon]MBU1165342.1 type II toxin-antitoxin system HicA family toxin [Candidatus Micrarchaeota archaeon]MBU1887224.1 type II toxin-antitoxin system HicA family toxin [Candidatus Micrarchaeota archaeon]
MKLPIVDAKTLIKVLTLKGYTKIRQSGSHVQFKNKTDILITVPVHPGQDIGRGLLRKIIRDMELTREEFIEILKQV